MKNILFCSIMLLVLSAAGFSQNSRLLSMGGLTYAVSDRDYSLNLYDFGGNPAWLINDEKISYLQIAPAFNRTWGNFKRAYHFESAGAYDVAFSSIKTLGRSGTYYGYAAYNYEQRSNVYKSLKYNTYAGEAFYTVDTVSGNFRYDGPRIGFIYGYELLSDLFFGAAVNYSLKDGLRNTYSNTKTLIREVDGKAGLAYKVSDAAVAGVSFYLFDSQESLEMKSMNGKDVVIFNFRGDKFSILSKKEILEHKVRKKGKGFDGQFHFSHLNKFEFALYGDYNTYGTHILIPQDLLREFEEGYADFENCRVKLKAKYSVTDNLQVGAAADYFENYSWSRNSTRNLLLWEWKLNGPSLGIGTSYYFSSLKLLLGAEYEISSVKADSSKYIDTRFVKINSRNNYARFGLEFEPVACAFIRAGYNFGTEQYDFVNGGMDVRLNGISLGFGYKIPGKAEMDICLYYGDRSPEYHSSYYRDRINLNAAVRLLSFN